MYRASAIRALCKITDVSSWPCIPNVKVQEKSQISFYKILKINCYHAKVLPKRFNLNGHTVGYR